MLVFSLVVFFWCISDLKWVYKDFIDGFEAWRAKKQWWNFVIFVLSVVMHIGVFFFVFVYWARLTFRFVGG